MVTVTVGDDDGDVDGRPTGSRDGRLDATEAARRLQQGGRAHPLGRRAARSSRTLNARGRRRRARAVARAESSARGSPAIACLVVMFVARVRTRAKAGKHTQGTGNCTVVVGEGEGPIRVSPKRSHSELEAGQGPSQLIPHHTREACSLGATYHYPAQLQTRPRFIEDGMRSGSVVAVTSNTSERSWYVHQYT
jgi:hypothetical protein